YSVEWVTGVIRFATERGLRRIEATPSAVNEWTNHVLALGQGQLMNEVGSWMTGVNRNVEGKQKPRIMRYSGGHPAYRQYCDAVAAEGYRKLAYETEPRPSGSLSAARLRDPPATCRSCVRAKPSLPPTQHI